MSKNHSESKDNPMKEYAVIYEMGENNWGAIVPDLPGCVSVGDTFDEVQVNVKEAIALYLEVLQERGEPIPEPKHPASSRFVAL